MTTYEAKEIYLNSDCSYFIMCTNHYSRYIQYRQLGLPKEQEDVWKGEKIQMLRREIRVKGDCQLFNRLYEIAVEFRDFDKLQIMMEAYKSIRQPLKPRQRVDIAETIIGRRLPKARSGIIYWAYDIGQKSVAILMMDHAMQCLNIRNVTEIALDRRIRNSIRRCKKMNTELRLNFSQRDLGTVEEKSCGL